MKIITNKSSIKPTFHLEEIMNYLDKLFGTGWFQKVSIQKETRYVRKKIKKENFEFEQVSPELTLLEKAIMLNAKIPVPEYFKIETEWSIKLNIKVVIQNLKKKVKVWIQCDITNCDYHVSKNYESQNTVLTRFKAFLSPIIENAETTFKSKCISNRQKFQQKRNAEIERHEQFIREITTLKESIRIYMQSSIILDSISKLNIELAEPEGYSIKETKPTYDSESNTLRIFEKHLSGCYHLTPHLKIEEERGALIIFVQRWEQWGNKSQTGTKHQAYFFFIKERRFLTRKSVHVKNLGDISDRELCYENDFGFSDTSINEIYNHCYVCGEKLHFNTPFRVASTWMPIVRACCSCVKKIRIDQMLEINALEKMYAKQEKIAKLNKSLNREYNDVWHLLL